jgi:hypothetical protein
MTSKFCELLDREVLDPASNINSNNILILLSIFCSSEWNCILTTVLVEGSGRAVGP